MLINAPASTNELLAQLKGVLVATDVALENVTRFRDWFLSLGADVTAAKAAFAAQYPDLTQAQVDLIYTALTDQDTLRKVANGQATQSPANDFFFNARKLWGPTLSRR